MSDTEPNDVLDCFIKIFMSHERLGYLVLGIVLAAAVAYGVLALRQTPATAPGDLLGTEVDKGEASPSESNLDEILRLLPTTEQSAFDPEKIEWIGYTDSIDRFAVVRPRGWDVSESSHAMYPEARRVVLSEGMAAFAVYPRGEFDVGLPSREATETKILLSGRPATMRAWNLPDGSWLAVVVLDAQPKNGFRIELSTLQPNPTARAILREMLNRFTFLEN